MEFKDIFKTNFLEKIGSFSLVDAIIALVMSFIIGLFIFVIYRKTYSGIMYNAGFGISLIAMTIITSFVILAVTSNVVLSLGMVGALSIVRFRTAIKEPIDIAFLFWSISVGIVLGAGLLPLAVIGSVMIGVILVAFSHIKDSNRPYILVIHYSDINRENIEQDILKAVERSFGRKKKQSVLKSVTEGGKNKEMICEVRIPEETVDKLLKNVKSVEGVKDTSLVSYNGEFV